MSTERLVAELRERHDLDVAETSELMRAQVRSIDGAHSVLRASLAKKISLTALAEVDPAEIAHRESSVERLARYLSPARREALHRQALHLRRASGAAPSSMNVLSDLAAGDALARMAELTPACARIAAEHPFSLIPQNRIRSFKADEQGEDRSTCVAFAAASCLEILHFLKHDTRIFLSQQFLYWQMRNLDVGDNVPPFWELGATKLGQAAEVLRNKGICSWELLPYDDTPPDEEPFVGPAPDDRACGDARTRMVTECRYRDYPDPKKRPKHGVAKQVFEQLQQQRPVAVAVPVFPAAPGSLTDNWKVSRAIRRGIVLDPAEQFTLDQGSGGHAVCVIGFVPSKTEPTGGHFLFRNSWDSRWATEPWSQDGLPAVPSVGYGFISATYVERYCWEWYAPIELS